MIHCLNNGMDHDMTNLMTHQQVLDLTGLSRMTLWRLRNRGEFIAHTRLSANRIAFDRAALNLWLADRTC